MFKNKKSIEAVHTTFFIFLFLGSIFSIFIPVQNQINKLNSGEFESDDIKVRYLETLVFKRVLENKEIDNSYLTYLKDLKNVDIKIEIENEVFTSENYNLDKESDCNLNQNCFKLEYFYFESENKKIENLKKAKVTILI